MKHYVIYNYDNGFDQTMNTQEEYPTWQEARDAANAMIESGNYDNIQVISEGDEDYE